MAVNSVAGIDSIATVEITWPVPWPYVINYQYVPLYIIIATAVAPRYTWVRPYA